MDWSGAESRRTVTVVFCDMAGSTALSERLDPEALRHVMLRYYARLRECLERHGGTVEKFIGDAVMAVFGVPVVHEDDALRAARAALDILAAVDDFGAELGEDVGVRIAVRIGVHTGEVVTSGDPEAGHTLVSGETVNVAARLEQHAPEGQILVGADTYWLLKDTALTTPVEPLTVKGKSAPVPAWRLLSVPSGAEPARGGPGDLLVGRDDELAQLDLAFGRVRRDRSCHLVTLLGDPGVGKSRLAGEFVARAGTQGALAASVRCVPYGSTSALQPLAELLRILIGDAEPTALLGSGEAESAAATALLRLARSGSSGTSFEETCWALQLLCARLAADRPLVLVLDDLQWAHEDLLRALDYLGDWVQGAPVLLMCVARTEFLEAHREWGSGKFNATALVVPPLAEDDCRELVLRLYEPEVVPHLAGSAVVDRLVSRSEGNPLFVEQIVAMFGESGSDDDVPPSVRAVVAARLDRLGPGERALLQHASVIGVQFSASGLRALMSGDDGSATALQAGPDVVDRTVRDLARRRLLEAAAPAGWRFVSQLIHDEVYSGMSKMLRSRQHEAFAGHLALDSPGDHNTMGTHLEQSYRLRRQLGGADESTRDLADRASGHLGTAGTLALAHGDVRWAMDMLRRAAELAAVRPGEPGALAVRLALAEARIAAGDAADAVAELGRLRADARSAGDRRTEARARLQLAYLDPASGGFGPLAETARDAVEVFTEADDALGLARAWLTLGQERQSRSLHAEASAFLERALTEAVRADAGLERAGVLGALTVSLWLGPEPAALALERCQTFLGELAGLRMARATVSCPMAVLLAMRGSFDEARLLIGDAEQTLTDLGHLFALPAVGLFLATVERLAGRREEAERQLRTVVGGLEELGDRQLLVTARADLARVLVGLNPGDSEARELADGLLAGDRLAEKPAAAADAHGVRARAAAAEGDAAGADRHAEAALRAARATDSPTSMATAELDRARVHEALGRTAEARHAAEAAHRHFTAKGHRTGAERAAELVAALDAADPGRGDDGAGQ